MEIEQNKLKDRMEIIKKQLAFSSWKKPLNLDEINSLQRKYAELEENLESFRTEGTSLRRQ
jgi:predicted nuclease with TOPRIM domain